MPTPKKPKSLIESLFLGVLLAIFGGIVLHAPLSVGLQTLFPSFELLIKSWKEILLILAGLLSLVVLCQRRQVVILREPLMIAMAAYALLHVALIPLLPQSLASTIAGLMIDLRYLLFFALVYIAVRLYPQWRRVFIAVFVAGALIVVSFAILQATVLPPDILKYIGYGPQTIMPFLTVDQNMEYIRISSTLRGPNPLGAFAVVTLALLAAYWRRGDHTKFRRPMFIVTVLVVGSFVALWASYSRSALIAAAIALGIVLVVTLWKRVPRWTWAGLAALLILTGGVLYAARDTSFVSNVLLHENLNGGEEVNSNDGHVDSLQDGAMRMVQQPLGGGVGSTGSASLLGDKPLIIENQYLFIAHEVGWIGLALFMIIFWNVLKALWRRRQEWLALGVFASGIGMALIGLLLPVWVDDTIGIIWWGLAAVAIGSQMPEMARKGKSNDGRTLNKKAKRTA